MHLCYCYCYKWLIENRQCGDSDELFSALNKIERFTTANAVTNNENAKLKLIIF